MSKPRKAEYLWLDGGEPTQQLRSKTRLVEIDASLPAPNRLPEWSFDGSSTGQADGSDSDCLLEPVRVVRDPRSHGDDLIVLCEVRRADGGAHASNRRARLRRALDAGAAAEAPLFGFEQEYTLLRGGRPLGWPAEGYPAPQGPFYCGVGADVAFGRDIVEAHADACLRAGLLIYGTNAEVMPGQWEFQIGHRGFRDEEGGALRVADELWIARFLLLRIAEAEGVTVSFDPKPVAGDWNGAGAHTNFSTRATRDPETGRAAIAQAITRLERAHEVHVAEYGAGNERRLTGLHETCSIDRFCAGVADRGASIRVPRQVEEQGYGYLEDRRPAANCDPYVVSARVLETVCDLAPAAAVERAA